MIIIPAASAPTTTPSGVLAGTVTASAYLIGLVVGYLAQHPITVLVLTVSAIRTGAYRSGRHR